MQHGGLKLKNPKKYTGTDREVNIGFKPIFDMIKSEGSRLEILSYTSTKGFVYTLHVDPDHTEYNGLNTTFSAFDKPITTFVLKVVIISPHANTPLTPYELLKKDDSTLNTSKKDNNLKGKYTESKETFFQECKMQQDVWSKSILGGREPICPSVANLVFFTNSQAKDLLRGVFFPKVESIDPHNTECQRTLKYLIDELELNKNFKLSIMTMSLERDTFTLNTFQKKYNTYKTRYKNIPLVQAIAQIIRLFIERSIIHFDLHSDNVLFYIQSHRIHCLLIDFERVCDLNNPILNKFIDHDSDRTYLNNIQHEKYNMFETLKDKINKAKKELMHETDKEKKELIRNLIDELDQEKIRFITEIITLLASVDEITNTELYGTHDKPIFQMDWINELPTNDYVKVFDALHIMTTMHDLRLVPNKIKYLQKKNYIITFCYTNGNDKIPEWFYEPKNSDTLYHSESHLNGYFFNEFVISNDTFRSSTQRDIALMKAYSKRPRNSKRSIKCDDVNDKPDDNYNPCVISGGKHKKSRKNKRNKNYNPKNKSRKFSNKNYLQ